MPEMRECELVGRESEDVEEDPNAEASRAAGKAIHTEGCSSCMGRNVQRELVWNGARQRSGGANPVVAEPPPSHPPLTQLSGVDLAELGDMLDRAARIAAWRSVPRASEILRRSSTSAVARSPADVLFGSSEPVLGNRIPPSWRAGQKVMRLLTLEMAPHLGTFCALRCGTDRGGLRELPSPPGLGGEGGERGGVR